jgi:hypothetical protein
VVFDGELHTGVQSLAPRGFADLNRLLYVSLDTPFRFTVVTDPEIASSHGRAQRFGDADRQGEMFFRAAKAIAEALGRGADASGSRVNLDPEIRRS